MVALRGLAKVGASNEPVDGVVLAVVVSGHAAHDLVPGRVAVELLDEAGHLVDQHGLDLLSEAGVTGPIAQRPVGSKVVDMTKDDDDAEQVAIHRLTAQRSELVPWAYCAALLNRDTSGVQPSQHIALGEFGPLDGVTTGVGRAGDDTMPDADPYATIQARLADLAPSVPLEDVIASSVLSHPTSSGRRPRRSGG